MIFFIWVHQILEILVVNISISFHKNSQIFENPKKSRIKIVLKDIKDKKMNCLVI